MEHQLLTRSDIEYENFRNHEAGYTQVCIFTKIDGAWHVMAKSIVKAIIEKEYAYGKDPYVAKMIEVFEGHLQYFHIADVSILRRVWNPPAGNFNKVTFVPLVVFVARLSDVFPEIEGDDLIDLQVQLKEILTKLGD